MSGAKDIRLKPVPAALARKTIEKYHYSGTSGVNSQLHVGVYLGASLEGAMQLGPPLDKRKLLGLVEGTPWDGMLELNRMAFSDRLPANAESRALGVLARIIRKHMPRVRWVVSFADATQCGDGTIYRAAGYLLTAIRASRNLVRLPNGSTIHKMTLESSPTKPRAELGGRSYFDVTGGRYDLRAYVAATGGEVIPGHQLRYVKFIDPAWRPHLTVEPLPYSAIAEAGAGMYLGKPRT